MNGSYIRMSVPKYMLQGGKNAGQHFHQVVYPKFRKLLNKILEKNPQELFAVLRLVLTHLS